MTDRANGLRARLGAMLRRVRQLASASRGAAPAEIDAGPDRAIRRLLVTGAAGGVARLLRPQLARRYPSVRLTDLRAPADLAPNEEWRACDLADRAALAQVLDGCDGVLHLGAVATEGPFERLAPANVHGVAHLLALCAELDVPRVVLASTMHVLGMHPRDAHLSHGASPHPDSVYAVTKLFAEQLARLYADKHGLRIACLRLGHVTASAADGEPGNWIGPADLGALTVAMLEHPAMRFEIVSAVAPHRGDALGQDDVARRFSVRWQEPGPPYDAACARVPRFFGPDPIAGWRRGGSMASAPLPRA